MHVIATLQLLLIISILWNQYRAFSTENQHSSEYDKQWIKLSSVHAYLQKPSLALAAVC